MARFACADLVLAVAAQVAGLGQRLAWGSAPSSAADSIHGGVRTAASSDAAAMLLDAAMLSAFLRAASYFPNRTKSTCRGGGGGGGRMRRSGLAPAGPTEVSWDLVSSLGGYKSGGGGGGCADERAAVCAGCR